MAALAFIVRAGFSCKAKKVITVTKYHLAVLANNFFIVNGIAPKHPVTPDDCADFAYGCYSILLSIPSDPNAKQRLFQYVLSQADYYGIPINKAAVYARQMNMQGLFFTYIKEHYDIESNGERIQRLIKEGFGFVGNAVAGAAWALIKPLIPLFGLGLLAVYLLNRTGTRQKS